METIKTVKSVRFLYTEVPVEAENVVDVVVTVETIDCWDCRAYMKCSNCIDFTVESKVCHYTL